MCCSTKLCQVHYELIFLLPACIFAPKQTKIKAIKATFWTWFFEKSQIFAFEKFFASSCSGLEWCAVLLVSRDAPSLLTCYPSTLLLSCTERLQEHRGCFVEYITSPASLIFYCASWKIHAWPWPWNIRGLINPCYYKGWKYNPIFLTANCTMIILYLLFQWLIRTIKSL